MNQTIDDIRKGKYYIEWKDLSYKTIFKEFYYLRGTSCCGYYTFDIKDNKSEIILLYINDSTNGQCFSKGKIFYKKKGIDPIKEICQRIYEKRILYHEKIRLKSSYQ